MLRSRKESMFILYIIRERSFLLPVHMSVMNTHIFPRFSSYAPLKRRSAERMELIWLNTDMEERARRLAEYIIEHRATVRAAAKQFGVSKSTVHKDLQDRLPTFNPPLYEQVRLVLEENKAERHIRGGIATRKKYKGEA